MKAIVFFTLALLGVMQAQAAELTTFQAGDPIYASELNGNFQELEARINALTASAEGLAGEPFNITLPISSDPVALNDGYDYYITDIIWALGATYSCVSAGTIRNAYISDDLGKRIIEIPPLPTGNSCLIFSAPISLGTPIKVSGARTLRSYWHRDAVISVIGYRIPVAAP